MGAIGDDMLSDLGDNARVVELERGAVFADQDGPAGDIYFIRSGRVASLRAADGSDAIVLREMGPGEIAGEVPIVGQPRYLTSLRAEERTVAVAVPVADLDALLERNPALATRMAEEASRRLRWRALEKLVAVMLGEADPAVVKDVDACVDWLRLETGDRLFSLGDPPDAVYFVVNGRVLVSVPSDEGADVEIAEIGGGEFVGELGLIDHSPRNADVTAIRETTLARIPRERFEELIREHPAFMLQLARIVVGRLARRGVPVDRAGTVTVTVTADIDPDWIVGGLIEEIRRHGSAVHLWSDRVNAALGRPNIADCVPGDPADLRLSEFLDESELEFHHVLYQTDAEESVWSKRVLRRADRVLIIANAQIGPAEDHRIRTVLATLEGARHVSRWIALVHPAGVVRPSGTARVLDRYGVDAVVHLRAGSPGDLERLARLAAGDGVGLVLGGGGARGFAHVGVGRALSELGIPVDVVAGSSIGAVMGAGIAAGYSTEELNELVTTRFRGLLDYTVPVVSLIKGRRITAAITDFFGGTDIEDLLVPFFCVSTNLTRATLNVHRRGDLASALRASVAIPGVLPPVPQGDDLLVDGSVMNNLPAGLMRDTGVVGKIIAVEVAPPRGPRVQGDFGLSVSGWRALRAKIGRGADAYPGLASVLVRSVLVGSMQERDRVVDEAIADLFLSLNLEGVGLLDFDDPEPVIRMGYEAALPQIESWLQSSDARVGARP